MSFILYNYLTGASPGGTWTYDSGLTPSPPPPATYDDTVSFTGYAAGTYVYKYTVGSVSSLVTVSWGGDGALRLNEFCGGAYSLGGFNTSPFSATAVQDDSRGPCDTGLASPIISSRSNPESWNQASVEYSGDLWYKATVPSCTLGYTVTVTVSSVDYPSPAKGLAVEVYTACPGQNCGVSIASQATSSNLMQTTVQTAITIPAANLIEVYIRVVAQQAGQYNVTLSSDFVCTNVTPSNCKDLITLSSCAEVFGYEPNFVFDFGDTVMAGTECAVVTADAIGYGPDFIFGFGDGVLATASAAIAVDLMGYDPDFVFGFDDAVLG